MIIAIGIERKKTDENSPLNIFGMRGLFFGVESLKHLVYHWSEQITESEEVVKR
ncbi:MAG: hypothetical protein H3C35_06010 [Bacteroidetes bacterium]|nr:hypothetical protein [Bacteroidota bacterium]